MVSKPQTRRSRQRLLQGQQLLNSIATPSPEGLLQDAPKGSTKRKLDDINQSPAKDPSTNAQLPEAESKGADEAPVLQHPIPKPPTRPLLRKLNHSTQPANSKHRFILEWLESVGPNRDRRCRLGSRLQTVLTSPALPMAKTRAAARAEEKALRPVRASRNLRASEAAGSSKPGKPPKPGKRSQPGKSPGTAKTPKTTKASESSDSSDTTDSSKNRLVKESTYRERNLDNNNIYYDYLCKPTPEHITQLMERMLKARKDEDPPGPSVDDIRRDETLEELSRGGAAESEVENYFLARIFSRPSRSSPVARSTKRTMASGHVPTTDPDPDNRVSTPVPDVLYGYTLKNAFPQQRKHMSKGGVVNRDNVRFPFLLIEFKGDGGDLWVATNQCLGGTATCVNVNEMLNTQLRQCTNVPAEPIESAVFSLAIRNTEARVFITWKQGEQEYHMREFGAYLVHDPKQGIQFHNIVRNILEWGSRERLNEIRKSLDCLREEKESQEKESQEEESQEESSTELTLVDREEESQKEESQDESSTALTLVHMAKAMPRTSESDAPPHKRARH